MLSFDLDRAVVDAELPVGSVLDRERRGRAS
jgi:hypothetical protein